NNMMRMRTTGYFIQAQMGKNVSVMVLNAPSASIAWAIGANTASMIVVFSASEIKTATTMMTTIKVVTNMVRVRRTNGRPSTSPYTWFMLRVKALTYAEADHSATSIPTISAITPPDADSVIVLTRFNAIS